MDRCKLEYMIKNFDFKEKKKMIVLIDPYGDYELKKTLAVSYWTLIQQIFIF